MMMDVQTIMVRVERLERQNRRMKLAAGSMLVVVGAGMLMGLTAVTKVPKVITAEKFVVVEKDGSPCIVLGPSADGGSSIQVGDRNGTRRLAGPPEVYFVLSCAYSPPRE